MNKPLAALCLVIRKKIFIFVWEIVEPLIKNRLLYGKEIGDFLSALRLDSRDADRAESSCRGGSKGPATGSCSLFEVQRGCSSPSAQWQDYARCQLRERGIPCGVVCRAFAALLPADQFSRRCSRRVGYSLSSLREGVLPLWSVPSGVGRCRASSRLATACYYVWRRLGLGG